MESTVKKTNAVDINDAFDSIFLCENDLVQEGFSEGFQKGTKDGEVSGFHLGYHRGAELGAEIGYYKGVVNTWLKLQYDNICQLSPKVVTTLEKVKALIDEFPKENSEEVDLDELKNKISAAYKKACSLLKFEPNYSSNITF